MLGALAVPQKPTNSNKKDTHLKQIHYTAWPTIQLNIRGNMFNTIFPWGNVTHFTSSSTDLLSKGL